MASDFQLFATLDPTTRQLDLPNKQQAILTDTVGFIQRLPHQLVAAFQSTLEEVVQSDVLLHVIDVSHELYKEQAAAVYQVLDELGAKDKTIITVYNKIDKLPPDSGLAERLSKEENSICISAKARYNLDGLLALIAENLKLKAVDHDLAAYQGEFIKPLRKPINTEFLKHRWQVFQHRNQTEQQA